MKNTILKILRFIKNLIKLFIPPIVWIVAVECGSYVIKKLAELIKKYPGRAMIAFGIILLLTNIFNYIGMKAKLNTAYQRYDSLEIHTDSVYELYNINKGYSYSRVVSYE